MDGPLVPLSPHPYRRRLTARERQIAFLVADGLKDLSISRQLGLSPGTVATYVRRIQLRLDLATRTDLAAWVNTRRDPSDPGAPLRRHEAD